MTCAETKKCLIYKIRPGTCRWYHCKKTLKPATLSGHVKTCNSTIGRIFGMNSETYQALIKRGLGNG